MIPTPIRVAIVGSGPSALYSAAHLLETRDLSVEIDIYEKLPTPWGLVRGGVAPDHPEKKLIIDRQFDFWLKHPRVRFFGNVEIGSDLTHEELASWYSAVIYAMGANGDVKMGVPGEDLAGSWAAREFVAYYNGHPEFSSFPFDFSTARAVVVGNGNVALDVARILTIDDSAISRTDIADHAIEALRRSHIREVVILGRRGPLQAAYNNPELEEMEHLSNVDVSVAEMGSAWPSADEIKAAGTVVQRKMATLDRLTARPRRPENKHIIFKFFRAPLQVDGTDHVERLVTACNALVPDGSGNTVLRNTGEIETIETGLILRAVGYRGTPFPGLPFDERRGVIQNIRGRVHDGTETLPGIYTTGWIKRGCNGIIGSNKKCANETTQHLLEDLGAGRLPTAGLDRQQIKTLLETRVPHAISVAQWSGIDHAERTAGRLTGRPRVKITTREGLLRAAMGS